MSCYPLNNPPVLSSSREPNNITQLHSGTSTQVRPPGRQGQHVWFGAGQEADADAVTVADGEEASGQSRGADNVRG
jgi:hypothetical protein